VFVCRSPTSAIPKLALARLQGWFVEVSAVSQSHAATFVRELQQFSDACAEDDTRVRGVRERLCVESVFCFCFFFSFCEGTRLTRVLFRSPYIAATPHAST